MKAGDIVVKEFPDSMTVYCYNFHDDLGSEKGACVKHIFTGPYETLKTRATDLFDRIQEGLELSWQGVTAGIAEGISAISSIISARASHLLLRLLYLGPYYSWESPRQGWIEKEVPSCVHQTRKLISESVSKYGNRDPGDESNLDETPYEEPTASDSLPSTSTSPDGKQGEDEAAESVPINHVVALAWASSGSKRVGSTYLVC